MRSRGGMHGWVEQATRAGVITGLIASVAIASTTLAVRGDGGQENPDLAASCGTDVVVILDESGSIVDPGTSGAPFDDDVEAAVDALARGLLDTGSRMRIVEFSNNARDALIAGSPAFRAVDASFVADLATYLTTSGERPQTATSYNPRRQSGDQQYTNWEAALHEAASPNVDTAVSDPVADGTPLVVFITDGDPNTVGIAGTSSNNNGGGNQASADAAIEKIARLQAAGSHVLSIAVGRAATSNSSYGRMTNLTEPGAREEWVTGDPATDLDLRTVDVLRVADFSDLDDAMRNVASSLCGSSVTINKVDHHGRPLPDRQFELTVQSLSGGASLEWESPATPPTTASTPSSRNLVTDVAGQARFEWTPGSIAAPQAWDSTVTVTETLPVGWVGGEALCQVSGAGAPIVLPATPGSGVVVYGPLTVGRTDVVVCDIVNRALPTITIVKDAVPDSATDFGFTTTSPDVANPLPAAFVLDDDADPALSNTLAATVDPGTYTVTEDDPVSAFSTLEAIECSGAGEWTTDVAARTATLVVAYGDAVSCTFRNDGAPEPALVVTKTPSVPTFPEPGGAVTYDVSVSNPNGAADPVRITGLVDAVRLSGGPATEVDLAGPLPAPVPGGSITASTCAALVGEIVGDASLECTISATYTGRNAGDLLDDTVTVTGADGFGRTVSAADDAQVAVTAVDPRIEVDKSVASAGPLVAPGGPITFRLDVTNPDDAIETVTLTQVSDQFDVLGVAFGGPIDVTTEGGAVTATTCGDLVGTALAPGAAYDCTFEVDTTRLGALAGDDVLRNTVVVTAVDDDPQPTPVSDDGTAQRTIDPAPALDVTKTPDVAGFPEMDATVVYSVAIINPNGAGHPIEITGITDTLDLNGGPGTLVDLGAATLPVDVPGGRLTSSTCADLIGRLVGGAALECTITVEFADRNAGDVLDDTVAVDGIDRNELPASGSDDARVVVTAVGPQIVVDKSNIEPSLLVAPGGVAGYSISVTNPVSAVETVTLTGVNDGFDVDGTAFGGPIDITTVGGAVTATTCGDLVGTVLTPGESYDCEISVDTTVLGPLALDAVLTNTVEVTAEDDDPEPTVVTDDDTATRSVDGFVDLELDKSDDGFETLAGGDPIPYTISVRNIGERDIDVEDTVTIVDTLPAFLSFRTPLPAGCSADGNIMTCSVDPASLPAGGPAVVLEFLVDVAADAPSGTHENHAYVTTQGDPVCEGEECTPPPCPEASTNNNVDCDDTSIERFASIFVTKTDDVADGEFVDLADEYSYELVTGNLGPSTVLSDLVIDDDLPDQVDLVSIDAPAGWTCNAVDPIECTWIAGAVAPGETLPAVTVNVRVRSDAAGTSIFNVVVVTALVDEPPTAARNALTQSHFGGVGDVVTAQDDETTPLRQPADLAITKTASVSQTGPGGAFEWVLEVRNDGPGTAENITIGDLVPAGSRVLGVSSPDFSCTRSGNAVTCTATSLASGESGTVTIRASVSTSAPAGSIDNVGTVESDTPDPDLTNNSDGASVTIVISSPATTQAPPPPVTLPRTGSDGTHGLVQAGVILLLAGAALFVTTRRRHRSEPAT